MATFTLEQPSRVVATKTMWPTKYNMFTLWPFTENLAPGARAMLLSSFVHSHHSASSIDTSVPRPHSRQIQLKSLGV